MQQQDWEYVSPKRKPAPKPKSKEAVTVARREGLQIDTHKKFEAGTNSHRPQPAIAAKKLENDDEDAKSMNLLLSIHNQSNKLQQSPKLTVR